MIDVNESGDALLWSDPRIPALLETDLGEGDSW